MSVLLEFSMFPTDKGESVSNEVSQVIKMISETGFSYKLTAMGTIVETDTMQEALSVVQKAHDILAENSERIYSSLKMDIRKNKSNRLKEKIESVENKIGRIEK
jgi:uncharacterized protein (TIGR00106 family)